MSYVEHQHIKEWLTQHEHQILDAEYKKPGELSGHPAMGPQQDPVERHSSPVSSDSRFAWSQLPA
ncbi:hypothetical protein [Streptomyces platensis]|uniref:hypothetical protein n=1 Tax=Streptomyces platensis TaxID=58346 RepID=UPI0037B00481